MKLLFVYDAPFYEEGQLVYTSDSLPSSVWINNYLPYFENVTVLARYSSNKKHKSALSSVNDRLIFKLILEYSSGLSFINRFLFNYGKVRARIREEIFQADVIIVRLSSLFGFIANNLGLNLEVFYKSIMELLEDTDSTTSLMIHKALSPYLPKLEVERNKKH